MSRFQDAIKEMKRKREKVIKEIALFVEAEAKLRTPVLTGHLKRSITHDTQTDDKLSKAQIGTNVEYAPVVELGSISKNIKPQPYLRPAVEENIGEIKEMIKRGLQI